MKKWMLCLLFVCLPVLAMAAPGTPYPVDTMLYYPMLTPEQQALFDLAYQAAYEGRERVTLPQGTSYDDVTTVMEAIYRDCPELCALGDEYAIYYYRSEPNGADELELHYTMPLENQLKLVQTAAMLVQRASGDTFQREWMLHDMLCARVTYDQQAAYQHTAWGALVVGRAVCDGYAEAMALLLRICGIPCGVVTGDSVASPGEWHAWNLVNIDGVYTWLDATNNDQNIPGSYSYFNITDEWLRRSYIPQGIFSLPSCTDESVNWHVKNFRMVERTEDMELHIFNNFRNLAGSGAAFSLRFRHEEDFLALANDAVGWAKRYEALGEHSLEGVLQVFTNKAQRCVMVQLEGEAP